MLFRSEAERPPIDQGRPRSDLPREDSLFGVSPDADRLVERGLTEKSMRGTSPHRRETGGGRSRSASERHPGVEGGRAQQSDANPAAERRPRKRQEGTADPVTGELSGIGRYPEGRKPHERHPGRLGTVEGGANRRGRVKRRGRNEPGRQSSGLLETRTSVRGTSRFGGGSRTPRCRPSRRSGRSRLDTLKGHRTS